MFKQIYPIAKIFIDFFYGKCIQIFMPDIFFCYRAFWEAAKTTTAAGGGGSFFQTKNAISPFFDASGNKNIGTTIPIGQEIRCLPYAGFFSSS